MRQAPEAASGTEKNGCPILLGLFVGSAQRNDFHRQTAHWNGLREVT
jgi:hypothetical protein